MEIFFNVWGLLWVVGDHNGSFLFLFTKAMSVREKNIRLAVFLFSIGINILALPISFFIGAMATDAPESTNLQIVQGFLFVQGLPLLMTIISLILLLKNKRN